MRLGKLTTKNFQSYKTLEFDFTDLGLCLLSGETGAGKSGILDAVSWTLYGETSKDSSADSIKSWFSEGETTESTLEIQIPGGNGSITRIRGPKNDLYITNKGQVIRGKDIPDTQKLINTLLGVTTELFMTSSYTHQFSKSDLFFIANAKERREILESIANLSIAITLADKASEHKKTCKKEIARIELEHSKHRGQLEEVEKTLSSLKSAQASWDKDKSKKIKDLQDKSLNFDQDKDIQIQKLVSQLEELDDITYDTNHFTLINTQLKIQSNHIDTLKKQNKETKHKADTAGKSIDSWSKELEKLLSLPDDTCPHCLGPTDNHNLLSRKEELTRLLEDTNPVYLQDLSTYETLQGVINQQEKGIAKGFEKLATDMYNNNRLLDRIDMLKASIIATKESQNHYDAQIKEVKVSVNPFDLEVNTSANSRNAAKETTTQLQTQLDQLNHRLTSINWLYDKSFEIRGVLLSKSVKEINDKVNKYLETYFDSRLRVEFDISSGDKVDVVIFNNGYVCPFKQLSGGERRMLAFTFNISVMLAAQNKSGIHFSTIMIDEGLNGFDNELKAKAYRMLEDLSKSFESILLIDHSEELKNQFDNVYLVQKYEDISEVIKQ